MAFNIEKSKLIIVEGEEDEKIFRQLISHFKLTDIQVSPTQGKTKLRSYLKALKTLREFYNVVSIGIVRDADENPDGAFQSVCSALKHVGLAAPRQPLISAGERPATSVLILPDINQKGMLEDIFLKSIENSTEMECVNKYFDCLKRNNLSLPKDIEMSKARVHVYLASKPRPDLRLGESVSAGYWNLENNIFKKIKDFLYQL